MQESNHDPAAGPFDTQDQARSLPVVRVTYDLAHGGPPGTIRLRNGQALTDTLIGSGPLDLGDYDRQVIAWLSQWEPQMVAVICSWITRAYAAGRGRCTVNLRDRLHLPVSHREQLASVHYELAELRKTVELHTALFKSRGDIEVTPEDLRPHRNGLRAVP